MDKDGFTSIVIELLDRVEPNKNAPIEEMSSLEIDGAALTQHLMELVGSDTDRVRVWNSSETEFSNLPNVAAYTLFATVTPPEKDADERGKEKEKERERQRDSSPVLTAILLTLLRLEREKTDVIVTVNVPHIKGEYDEEDVDFEMGKTGTLIGTAVSHTSKVWATFKINDYGLFKADDGA